ncbi:MAG: response regulator [Patescibacteria group bacterium]|nr:response regulator [Patescibacteria group bacterium]
MDLVSKETGTEPKKILIIEDDAPLSAMVQNRFKRELYETVSALNGSEGLDAARKYRPDIIVLDLLLPVMNGFDVLSALRKDELTRDIPVLVLSNLSRAEDIQRTQMLGANGYLVKTDVSLKYVTEKIKDLLSKGSAGQSVRT